MGWYDSGRVCGGQDFQVDAKAEIKWDYRGDIREYLNESKIVLNCFNSRRTVRMRDPPQIILRNSHLKDKSHLKVI